MIREQIPEPGRRAGGRRREPRLSVVVPCHDEREGIVATLDELREVLGRGPEVEIVVVDDGSGDGTGEIVDAESEADPAVSLVRHPARRGYGAALKTGIRHATGEWILIVDADGSYPASAIPSLLEHTDRHDMVVGARTLPGSSYPWLRRVPKLFLRRLASWLAASPIPDMNSGLRVFRREIVLRYLKLLPEGFSFTTTITIAFFADQYRVRFVPILLRERIGDSKIRPVRDTLRFSLVLLRAGMYFAPLRLLSPVIFGLFLAFLTSLGYDVLALGNLTDKTVMLLLFALNTALFGLLADMVHKRSGA